MSLAALSIFAEKWFYSTGLKAGRQSVSLTCWHQFTVTNRLHLTSRLRTCSLSRTASPGVCVPAAPCWSHCFCTYSRNSSTSFPGRTPGLHSNWSSKQKSRRTKRKRPAEMPWRRWTSKSLTSLLIDVGTQRRDLRLILWANHDLLLKKKKSKTKGSVEH